MQPTAQRKDAPNCGCGTKLARRPPSAASTTGNAGWKILVIAEPVAEDLVRGWLSFRLDDEKYDTAPVIMEETVARVVERAVELPAPMLRQLFSSARR